VRGHVRSPCVTLAILIPLPRHIEEFFSSHFESDYKNTLRDRLGHLVLMVEESVDARPGAGVPNLHALVRRAERGGGGLRLIPFN